MPKNSLKNEIRKKRLHVSDAISSGCEEELPPRQV